MSELRKDPITDRWVIITGESSRPLTILPYSANDDTDGFCPFCPGHEDATPAPILTRTDDTGNWKIRVVPNKFAALRIENQLERMGVGMYDVVSGVGAHEVVIETANHHQQYADMEPTQLAEVLAVFRERMLDLNKDSRFRYVLIFKNFGEEAGASLTHAHSQIIALPITPKRVHEELKAAMTYYQQKERCIFCDMLRQEKKEQQRIIDESEHFYVIAPYASRFPFETHIFPKRHSAFYFEISDSEIADLAQTIRRHSQKLRKGLDNPPFNMMIHSGPNMFPKRPRGYWKSIHDDFHWHIEIVPRLVMVAGFEWGTGFHINPTFPEEAAQYLRELQVDPL